MTFYLISFPSPAMQIPAGEFAQVVADSHAVIDEAKAAGVFVFGGGIADVPPVMVSGHGIVTEGTYPQTREIEGGYTILDLPSRDAAIDWAAKIAAACRCAQELREFHPDAAS
ncbi:YciI family protein [Microbacterium sp. W1N]|uniref:YciI family protein n=1 Tax=Microbacterium festucae TaxID=2977531 RepID=UPI0021C15C0C|nr:YciI family protein [Microbacterium festucae]MCT9820507.1 YciI family protein [Microbacterium festucae]